jgi:hypothetical protein
MSTTDPFLSAFDSFADTVESSVIALREELRAVRAENERLSADLASLRAAQVEVRGFDPDAVRPLIEEAVRSIEPREGPRGEDGASVTVDDVRPLVDEAVRVAVAAIPAPKDGKDGEPGKDGKDGEPGRDGADGMVSREEVEELVEQRVREVQVRSLADYDRGVFKRGESYSRGDLVTWDGSMFMAVNDTQAVPESDKSWRKLVKRGRDGRDRT